MLDPLDKGVVYGIRFISMLAAVEENDSPLISSYLNLRNGLHSHQDEREHDFGF